ncbi:MAG TPA: hypothetical protein VFA39_04910 [Steroidobacteraceae bacterium]|nr:hypothetical protein [Steroidobacteraceae bacterium]
MLSETGHPSRPALFAGRMLPALVCSALALTGCATTVNVQAYPGARRPAQEVAKVRALESQILSVDGAPTAAQCGGRLMNDCYVLFLPGSHSMSVQPMSLNGGSGPGYIAPTVATPGMYMSSSAYYLPVGTPVMVRYAVEGGHSYSLITDKTCVANPADTPPEARSKPEDKGLCLIDITTGQVVHSQD